MGKFKNMVKSQEVREYGQTMLGELISVIIGGDFLALGELIKNIIESPFFIREQIFWQNFIEFLDNTCDDEEDLRRFSAKLAEDGNSSENAKRIIKIIDDAGTKRKAIYISNLTRACCMEYININKYFKLSQCIVRLTDEDLEILCDNISEAIITTDEDYIDDFRNCGLLKEVAGGFAYTERAYELKKYSLWYGHDVQIPAIPERQMQTDFDFGEISEEEIAQMFKNNLK